MIYTKDYLQDLSERELYKIAMSKFSIIPEGRPRHEIVQEILEKQAELIKIETTEEPERILRRLEKHERLIRELSKSLAVLREDVEFLKNMITQNSFRMKKIMLALENPEKLKTISYLKLRRIASEFNVQIPLNCTKNELVNLIKEKLRKGTT